MRITFVFEGLFPGKTRAARHVEAMARRFLVKGHGVTVITTSQPSERDPEGIHILRLGHAPASVTDKDAKLIIKNIVRHLNQEEIQVLFAESLTPLSALAVKAARECHIPTIVRVLADREGIVHGFAATRRTSRRTIQKKISALLEHATVAAASSARCAELLGDVYKGPVHIIEKCVDLNLFRRGRTTRRDLESFLARFDARGRRILLYAREQPRESTPQEIFPVLPLLREYAADVLFLVAGDLDDEALLEGVEDPAVRSLVRATGRLEGRDLFAAYDAASLFLVPPRSRASAREILEAMAMGLPVACFEETAAAASEVVVPGESGVVLPAEDPTAAARILGELLQDEERLARLGEAALAIAREHDLDVAIDQVEQLAVQVLGLPAITRDEKAGDTPDEAVAGNGKESQTMAKEEKKAGGSRGEGGGGRRRGGRGRRRAEPEKPAETPAASGEEKTQETSTPAEEPAESTDAGEYEGVTFVGEESSSSSSRRRGRRRSRGRGRGGDDVEELGATTGIDVLEVPAHRERRRRGGLEPGLTLKDLMPFLRAPKTVLILGLSTGAGHARVATALAEAFKAADRNIVVRQVDLLDVTSKRYSPLFVRTWLEDLARNPALFGKPFETIPEDASELPEDLDEVLDKVFDQRLDELVVDKRPDYVICTHWLPLRHLERLKEEEKLSAGVLAMVSDPVCHRLWVSKVPELYVVPDEEQRLFLLRHDIDVVDPVATGIPVAQSFSEKIDADEVRKELGIPGGQPTILLRPGGIGATERILETVQRLMDPDDPVNLLVVAGKNDRLRDELEKLETPGGSVVKAFGFVQNIREMMGVSDLLISRASPHTVAEALAAGLPMVLLRPAPGMEERLADNLLSWNAAVKAYGEEDLELLVPQILKNRRRLRTMQDASRSHGRRDAAVQAMDRLARCVR